MAKRMLAIGEAHIREDGTRIVISENGTSQQPYGLERDRPWSKAVPGMVFRGPGAPDNR